jgi:hypothetical protein
MKSDEYKDNAWYGKECNGKAFKGNTCYGMV